MGDSENIVPGILEDIIRYNQFMNAVRTIREVAGLSQKDLAHRSGLAQPNIAAYESGRRVPSEAMLKRISAAAPPRPSAVLAEYRSEILAIVAAHQADNVRVFGSISRGEDLSGSDIDLLVRFAPTASVFDLADLVEELVDLTDLHVDVVSEGGLRTDADPIADEAVPL